MTDRIRALTVILEQDTRDDDAAALVSAISLLAGVAEVKLGPPITLNDAINRDIVRLEMRRTILRALDDEARAKLGGR